MESPDDSFSKYGARAFKAAIKAIHGKGFNLCTVGYTAGNPDMKKTIRQLVTDPDGCACRVNVVFAQTVDLVQLFLEAHKQNYKGEWVVGGSLFGSLSDVARDMKNELKNSSVYEILQGMCEC